MAKIIDLYDKDILDDDGEALPVRKTVDETFYERITGIIPVHIKHLSKKQLIRLLEILVKRNLGSERVFRDHLLLKIERSILKFDVA